MIPATNTILTDDLEIETQPSLNHRMLIDQKRIIGTCNELEAMEQVVFKILSTERYDYIIYSWDYGTELKNLYGEPLSYVCCELEERIKEATPL